VGVIFWLLLVYLFVVFIFLDAENGPQDDHPW
jgi:hypothetical protein